MNALRRLTYAYLSRMYALMYFLSRRPFLSALVRWLPLAALFIGWLQGWPPAALLVVALVAVWINYSLWRARRDNYNRFVADARPLGDAPPEPPLPPNQRLEVLATGLFSVSGRESRLFLRPARYWHVPLGDHIIMAEEEPGKYLYQFFSATTLQELREGLLLYGTQPTPALAVSFLARWGPEHTRFCQVYELGQDEGPPPKRITVYLTSADENTRRLIRETIISTARRARLSGVA
ncbi:MAG TPA: hypothetical protein PLH39_10375 [Promineifilum sp.]|nr:hypothetical protein [Promineifilum sp.]